MSTIVTYTRLFADADGQSHFAEAKQSLQRTSFAPPSGDLFTGELSASNQTFWVAVDSQWTGDVPHPAPRRQLFCTVRGTYEITASDGQSRRFPPGSVLLLEDTIGQGHRTRVVGADEVLVLAIALPDFPKLEPLEANDFHPNHHPSTKDNQS